MSFVAMLLAVSAASAAEPRAVDRVPEDFATIAEAVAHGTAPVIRVGPGEWQGAVVDRRVRLIGEDAVIVGGVKAGALRPGFALTAGATGTEVRGFEFACDGRALDAGVFTSARRGGAADKVTVADNVFGRCVQAVTNAGWPTDDCVPARLTGGSYWVVTGNVFDGFATRAASGAEGGGIGVFLFNVEAADVIENLFTGEVEDRPAFTTSGVFMAGCWDCTVALNDFEVSGGRHYWSAVSNFGYYQAGAAASRNVAVLDNDASRDSAPHRKVSFRSYDSQAVELDGNRGQAWVDHALCAESR